MAKRLQQEETGTETPGRLEQVAEDLGSFLGTVTGRVESWVGERDKLVEQLRQIQTTAGNLLSRLTGSSVTTGPGTQQRGPRRQLATATAQAADSPAETPKGRKRRKFSAATIAKMRAAQRARWAKVKGEKR